MSENLLLQTLIGRFERDKAERWHQWYGKAIIAGYRKEPPLDDKYQKAPTFKEFVQFLVELPLGEKLVCSLL